MKKVMTFLISVLCLSQYAHASISAGHVSGGDNEQTQNALWSHWPVVGQAQLSMLFFDIYQSELRAPNGQYRESDDVTPHPLALSITYQRNISQDQLLNATMEQWQKLGYREEVAQGWLTRLAEVFPNIEQGHNLTYVTNGQVGEFYYTRQSDTQRIGIIDDEAFNDAFVSIWLSPNTDYPRLRQQLIGKQR